MSAAENAAARQDLSWVDSMTLEAKQRTGKAIVLVADLQAALDAGRGKRDDQILRRLNRELREIRSLLVVCRSNHVRPLVEAEAAEGGAA